MRLGVGLEQDASDLLLRLALELARVEPREDLGHASMLRLTFAGFNMLGSLRTAQVATLAQMTRLPQMRRTSAPIVTGGLLTPQEVAASLRLSPGTVYRLLRAGEIRGVHIAGTGTSWRIPATELERILGPLDRVSA